MMLKVYRNELENEITAFMELAFALKTWDGFYFGAS